MKIAIQILLLILTLTSCQTQEVNVRNKNIEINIPGRPGPWLMFNGEYYSYFKTDNGSFSSASNHQFYILDRNGKIKSKVNVPEELQTFYYDLYIKNDTIFTTEYYDHNTFYLDLKNNKWIETEKGIDLHYEDKDYSVYSLDFGEWGAATWFKNKQTNKQYEIGAETPVINKLNDAYYLTTSKSVLKVDEPEKLDISKEPYDYKKAVLDKHYHRDGIYSTNGAETLFEYENDDYFNPTFLLATSFVSKNKLYHFYKDSISTKIGKIQNKKLVSIHTFTSEIQPFQCHYDNRNRIQNNNSQSVQFRTDKDNVYGIIEINGDDFNVSYFENTYKEAILGEDKMKEWLEKTFDFYYSNFNNLNLNQIDKIEQNENATKITQRHKISTYLLEGKDIETPEIFRKKESEKLSLVTMYYYTTDEKRIELIEFEWKKKNNVKDVIAAMENDTETVYKLKFDWLSDYLQDKFGAANSSKVTNSSAEQKWVDGNIVTMLSYDKYEIELTIYRK